MSSVADEDLAAVGSCRAGSFELPGAGTNSWWTLSRLRSRPSLGLREQFFAARNQVLVARLVDVAERTLAMSTGPAVLVAEHAQVLAEQGQRRNLRRHRDLLDVHDLTASHGLGHHLDAPEGD